MKQAGWLALICIAAGGGWWATHTASKVYVPSTLVVPRMNIDVNVMQNTHNVPIWTVRHAESRIVTVCVCFKFAGFTGASPKERGISNVLASLLDEGYKGKTGRELKEFFLNHCIDYNVASDADHITLTLRTIPEKLPQLFESLTGMVTSPLCLENDAKRIQAQLLASLQQQMHLPQTSAGDKRTELAYGKEHPYAFSTAEQAARMTHWTSHQLKTYAKRMLTRKRLHVVVVGSFEEGDLKKQLDDFMQALTEGEDVPLVTPTQSKNDGSITILPMQVPQTVIAWTQEGLNLSDPQFYALNLVNEVIGGGGGIASARLMREVREKNGLAYFIGSRLSTEMGGIGWFGRTGTQTDSAQKVMDMIRVIWKETADKGISRDELEQVRSYVMQSFPHVFTSTTGISRALMRFMLSGRAPDYVKKRNEYFQKVTLEDANNACKNFMKSTLTFVVVGKHEAGALK